MQFEKDIQFCSLLIFKRYESNMANYKWYGCYFFSLSFFSYIFSHSAAFSYYDPAKMQRQRRRRWRRPPFCMFHSCVFVCFSVIISRNKGNQDKCKNKEQIDLLIIDCTQMVWQFLSLSPILSATLCPFYFHFHFICMLSSFVHIAEVIRMHKNNPKTTH